MAQTWENIYRQRKSILLYPDSTFLSLSHRLLNKDQHHSILDYGFGYGSNMISLLRRGFDLSGVEISPTVITLVKQRLKNEHLCASLKLLKDGKIPFDDNTFDAVIAWQVLDYNTWEGLANAVKEIDRVLRPGGLLIGTMTSTEDGLCQQARKFAQGLYQMRIESQKGMIKMAINRREIAKCFPKKKVSVGKLGFDYDNIQSSHWIITYEK